MGRTSAPECSHGRAEMGARRVVERTHQRVAFERGLDDAALHAGAAAVNQANLAQPGTMRGADVLVDDRTDVARVEGVEVERVFDWNLVRRVRVVRHRVTPPSMRVRPWVPPAF